MMRNTNNNITTLSFSSSTSQHQAKINNKQVDDELPSIPSENRIRRRPANNATHPSRLRLLFLSLVVVASVPYLFFTRNSSSSTSISDIDVVRFRQSSGSIPNSKDDSSTAQNLVCNDPSTSYLQIKTPSPSTQHIPKILCIVLTSNSNHATRLQAIRDTWGPKCTGFIAASDADDPTLHAYKIDGAIQGYWGIWDKLLQTLGNSTNLLMNHLHHPIDYYDWILKADDDTYIIMENLQDFLINQHQTYPTIPSEPLIFGRTMPWPTIDKLSTFPGWFHSETNYFFGVRFLQRFPLNHTLVYAHGGPGYIMNRKYVQLLTEAYFTSTTITRPKKKDTIILENAVKGKVSEDLANAVTMLFYKNVTPKSTLDTITKKERSHPESPQIMYDNPNWLKYVQENIQNLGKGPECCSPTSFGFHHVSEHTMRVMDYQLYKCPRPQRDDET